MNEHAKLHAVAGQCATTHSEHLLAMATGVRRSQLHALQNLLAGCDVCTDWCMLEVHLMQLCRKYHGVDTG
jgi:hypothetical protein